MDTTGPPDTHPRPQPGNDSAIAPGASANNGRGIRAKPGPADRRRRPRLRALHLHPVGPGGNAGRGPAGDLRAGHQRRSQRPLAGHGQAAAAPGPPAALGRGRGRGQPAARAPAAQRLGRPRRPWADARRRPVSSLGQPALPVRQVCLGRAAARTRPVRIAERGPRSHVVPTLRSCRDVQHPSRRVPRQRLRVLRRGCPVAVTDMTD